MQTPICSRAVPRFLLLCPRPGPVVLQRSRVQRRQPWHGMCGRQRVVHSGVYLCVACQGRLPVRAVGVVEGVVPPLPPCSATAIMLYASALSCRAGGAGWCMVTRAGRRTDGRARCCTLHAVTRPCQSGLISLDVISVASAVGDGYATRLPAYVRLRFFVPACLPIASAGLPPSACSAPIVGWGVVSGSLCCLMGASTSVVLCMCYHSRLGQCVCVYLLLPPPRDKCISRVRNFYSETKGLWSRFG